MNNQTERLRFLLGLYAENQANEKQVQEMLALLKTTGNSTVLENFILELKDGSHERHDVDWNKVWKEIELATSSPAIVHKMEHGRNIRSLWKRIAVAASIVLLIGLGIVISKELATEKSHPAVAITHDVKAPATNRAMITLADGRVVALDSLTSIAQGRVNVIKNEKGEVIYSSQLTTDNSQLTYNTLTNPRGSKVVNLTLSDGTKIWLNSESSLKYPVAFNGRERKVEITGEAYFIVMHNTTMPFKVVANGTVIEDLGTEFNVNSYEGTKTTLIQGSVQISAPLAKNFAPSAVKLKPGEQAQINNHDDPSIQKIMVQTNVDVEEVIAWKNGKFQFNAADIQEIMKQVGRWYDVDVVYEGKVSDEKYRGKVSRDLSLMEVIKVLQLSNVKVKLEGKKLTIVQ